MAAGSGRWAVGGGLFWRVGVDSRRVVNSLLRWFFDALSVERRVFGRRGVTREGRWRPNGRFCSRLVDRERGKSRRDIVTPRRDIATTRRDDVTMRFSSLTAVLPRRVVPLNQGKGRNLSTRVHGGRMRKGKPRVPTLGTGV